VRRWSFLQKHRFGNTSLEMMKQMSWGNESQCCFSHVSTQFSPHKQRS
jgi:hypothetical protein